MKIKMEINNNLGINKKTQLYNKIYIIKNIIKNI